MASFGIVYATESKMIRRIVTGPTDYQMHAGLGESVLVADDKDGTDLFTCRALVEAATGVAPPDHACAVVDPQSIVVKIIAADPALDAVEGHTLVAAYPGVFAGCTYVQATDSFVAPVEVIPAHISEKGEEIPAQVVGGRVAKPVEVAPKDKLPPPDAPPAG